MIVSWYWKIQSSLHQHVYLFNHVLFCFPSKEPSVGPDNVSFSELNETTFNISWDPLTREKSYGEVILYEIKEELVSRVKRRKRSPISSRTLNTTTTFVILHDLLLCSQYHVFVRAHTNAGPGPYSQHVLQTSSKYNQNIQTWYTLVVSTIRNFTTITNSKRNVRKTKRTVFSPSSVTTEWQLTSKTDSNIKMIP